MNAELPTTLIGLLSLSVVTIGGLMHLRTEQRSQGRKMDDVHAEVRNEHQSNLRDDIDRIITAVTDIRADIKTIRDDIRTERSERAAEDRQLAERIRRL